MWTASDSMAWDHVRDSIVTAFRGRGGEPLACEEHAPPLAHVASSTYWRFPDYDVRVLAYRYIPGAFGGEPNSGDVASLRWVIQLDGWPDRAPWC
jgi:hypothetical protein